MKDGEAETRKCYRRKKIGKGGSGTQFPSLEEHSHPSHLFIYLGFPGASLSGIFGQCFTLWCDRLQDTSLIQASWLIFGLKRSPVTS